MNQLELSGVFHAAFEIAEPAGPCLPGLTPYAQRCLRDAERTLLLLSKSLHMSCEVSDASVVLMRAHLMTEELGEVFGAMAEGSIRKTAHELNDLGVVHAGSVRALGLTKFQPEVMRRVHNANMTKLDADGRPLKNAAGRILKSPFFIPADLTDLFPNEESKQ